MACTVSLPAASVVTTWATPAPVIDGIVLRDGTRLALQGSHGRVNLGNPPTALRAMVGARVWVGGPLDTGPNTYGVIVPSP